VDVPALGVAAALGERIPPQPAPRTGLRYVSAGDEVRDLFGRPPDGGRATPVREVVADIVRGAVSPNAVLDPPLRDPLWIGADILNAARDRARRILRP
jgi:hypothetical protein